MPFRCSGPHACYNDRVTESGLCVLLRKAWSREKRGEEGGSNLFFLSFLFFWLSFFQWCALSSWSVFFFQKKTIVFFSFFLSPCKRGGREGERGAVERKDRVISLKLCRCLGIEHCNYCS